MLLAICHDDAQFVGVLLDRVRSPVYRPPRAIGRSSCSGKAWAIRTLMRRSTRGFGSGESMGN